MNLEHKNYSIDRGHLSAAGLLYGDNLAHRAASRRVDSCQRVRHVVHGEGDVPEARAIHGCEHPRQLLCVLDNLQGWAIHCLPVGLLAA